MVSDRVLSKVFARESYNRQPRRLHCAKKLKKCSFGHFLTKIRCGFRSIAKLCAVWKIACKLGQSSGGFTRCAGARFRSRNPRINLTQSSVRNLQSRDQTFCFRSQTALSKILWIKTDETRHLEFRLARERHTAQQETVFSIANKFDKTASSKS